MESRCYMWHAGGVIRRSHSCWSMPARRNSRRLLSPYFQALDRQANSAVGSRRADTLAVVANVQSAAPPDARGCGTRYPTLKLRTGQATAISRSMKRSGGAVPR